MHDTAAEAFTGRAPRVISVFSGMEAASVASMHLGWKFTAFSEIEPVACRTLHFHHRCGRPLHLPRPEDASNPHEARVCSARIRTLADMPAGDPGAPPNLGDVAQAGWDGLRGTADVVVGGPPCQAFSTAGFRRSLGDERGNLTLLYARAIHAVRPLWVFTENVPGWLSTKDNAFGCYPGALVGAAAPLPPPGGKRWGCAGVVDGPLYRAAWRVLDAQGFVPQRRRRVFVVAARTGSGGDPVRVLFETEAEALGHLGARACGGALFPDPEGVRGNPPEGAGPRQEVAGALQDCAGGGCGGGGGRIVVAFGGNNCSGPIDVATAATAHGGPNNRCDFESETFLVEADGPAMRVRRLTPGEYLSLQGFPPGYLDGVSVRGGPLTDGAKYKLSGNSWAVPLVSWTFGRIDAQMRSQIRRGAAG